MSKKGKTQTKKKTQVPKKRHKLLRNYGNTKKDTTKVTPPKNY